MAKNSSFSFSALLLLSILSIGTISLKGTNNINDVDHTRAIMVFVSGMLPLVIYHLILRGKKGNLTQDKIDSVYYFGFLVTLATLGSSAFILSTVGVTAINTVGAQFALGLLVTGYGLWARITLQNKLSTEESINASLDGYIDKVASLNEQFDQTIKHFNNLRESAADNIEQAGASVIDSISKNIQEPTLEIKTNLKAFSDAINKLDLASLDEASQSIQEFSTSLKSASSESPRLAHSMSLLSNEISNVNQNYLNLAKAIEDELQGISKLTSSFASLSASGDEANKSLGQFNTTLSQFNKLDFSDFNNISISLKNFLTAIERSANGMDKLNLSITQNQGDVLSIFDGARSSLSNQAKELNAANQELGGAMSALASTLNQAATKLSR